MPGITFASVRSQCSGGGGLSSFACALWNAGEISEWCKLLASDAPGVHLHPPLPLRRTPQGDRDSIGGGSESFTIPGQRLPT